MLLQSTDYLNFNLYEELLDDEIHSVTTDSMMTPTRKPPMTDHSTPHPSMDRRLLTGKAKSYRARSSRDASW